MLKARSLFLEISKLINHSSKLKIRGIWIFIVAYLFISISIYLIIRGHNNNNKTLWFFSIWSLHGKTITNSCFRAKIVERTCLFISFHINFKPLKITVGLSDNNEHKQFNLTIFDMTWKNGNLGPRTEITIRKSWTNKDSNSYLSSRKRKVSAMASDLPSSLAIKSFLYFWVFSTSCNIWRNQNKP